LDHLSSLAKYLRARVDPAQVEQLHSIDLQPNLLANVGLG
jgi:hypothetical protein